MRRGYVRVRMDLGLSGKIAVVSGASKGIGLAISRELAAAGCSLAICARGLDDLKEAAEDIGRDHGVDVLAEQTDVTSPADVERLRDGVVDRFGRVDILVNNAGRAYPGKFETLTDENFLDDYTVKALSHVRMIRAFLPALKDSGDGRVVNINSIHGKHPDARFFTSSVNRAASLAFSRTMALYLARDNVRVNSVNIGYVLTPQWDNVHKRSRPDLERDVFFREIADADVPMGRMGRPEEVAGAVAFLCSNRSAYITGAELDVGGGMG